MRSRLACSVLVRWLLLARSPTRCSLGCWLTRSLPHLHLQLSCYQGAIFPVIAFVIRSSHPGATPRALAPLTRWTACTQRRDSACMCVAAAVYICRAWRSLAAVRVEDLASGVPGAHLLQCHGCSASHEERAWDQHRFVQRAFSDIWGVLPETSPAYVRQMPLPPIRGVLWHAAPE